MFGVGVRSSLGVAKKGLGLPGLSQAALPGINAAALEDSIKALPDDEAVEKMGPEKASKAAAARAASDKNSCSASRSMKMMKNLDRIRSKLDAVPGAAAEPAPDETAADPDAVIGTQQVERHVVGQSDPQDLLVSLPEHVQSALGLSHEVGPFAEVALKRRGGLQDPEEVAAAADTRAARTAPSRPKVKHPGLDPDPDTDWNFDFSGDGRPFRFARGKASRIRSGHDVETTRATLKRTRAQLRGGLNMEVAERDGVVRHAGVVSPVAGLGECGDPECGANRIFRPEVRSQFRDFIIGWASKAMNTDERWHGEAGICYVSLGSGQLLFDLELLERLRSMRIRIAQVCLIDREYRQPDMEVRRALREFADWQRAVSQMDREQPAEVYAFGWLEDYIEAVREGTRISGCHLLVQCDAYWETVLEDCEHLAQQTLLPEGLFARLNPEPFLTGQPEATKPLPNQHSEEPYSVAAWTLDTESERLSLKPVEDFLLEACNAAIAVASESPLSSAVEGARERARVRARARATAKAKQQEEELAQKKVEAEIEAHNKLVELKNAEVKAQTEKVMAARARREEILEARRTEVEEHKSNALVPHGSDGDRKTWIRELEAKGLSLWRVVNEPRVVVRAQPRVNSQMLGALPTGTEVVAGLTWEGWLQVAQAPKGVKLPEEAWICYDASDSGNGKMLVQVSSEDAGSAPEPPQAFPDRRDRGNFRRNVPAKSAVPNKDVPEISDTLRSFADVWVKEQALLLVSQAYDRAKLQELEEHGLTLWRVVQDPQVPIRMAPKSSSKIVGAIYPGEDFVSGPKYQGFVQIAKGPLRLTNLASGAWVPLRSTGGSWMLREIRASQLAEVKTSTISQACAGEVTEDAAAMQMQVPATA